MLEYLELLGTKHRATLGAHIKDGKTYRSRFIAYERGYLMALADIEDLIRLPQKNAELQKAMAAFGKRFKV